MTDKQWENLQKLSAYKQEKAYTNAEMFTFWFCGAVMAYLAIQVVRVVL